MKDFLFLIFSELGLSGYKQGTRIPEVEPNAFFTFWRLQDGEEYVDNIPAILKNNYSVVLYVHTRMLLDSADYLEETMNLFIKRARELGLAVSGVEDTATGLDNYVGVKCFVRYAQHE